MPRWRGSKKLEPARTIRSKDGPGLPTNSQLADEGSNHSAAAEKVGSQNWRNEMKQSVAMKHLRTMLFTIQKIRSTMDENGEVKLDDQFSVEVASGMWKYIWGNKSVLPILSKVIDQSEETGKLEPLAFYNMMIIATEFEPLIMSAAGAIDETFPAVASIYWLLGWDPECNEM